MKELRNQKAVFIWLVVISFILIIILTCFQITYSNLILLAIINNLIVCILTGGLVALIQSVIALKHLKHNLLLNFYKDSCFFDEAVIHYSSTTYGFSKADLVIEKIHSICTTFDCTVKSSYMLLDVDKNEQKDLELNAANALFNSFSNETHMYRDLQNLLYEGIKFMRASEDELREIGIIDVASKNKELNMQVQEAADKTIKSYNDEQALEMRAKAFKILENYLFKSKS